MQEQHDVPFFTSSGYRFEFREGIPSVSRGMVELRRTERGFWHRITRGASGARVPLIVLMWLLIGLHALVGQEPAAHRWPVKVLQRLLAPFRSNPFLQSNEGPCGFGRANCFFPTSRKASSAESEFTLTAEDSDHPIMLELRTDHEGPLAHHWLELEGEEGGITVGFGPATLPFIDSGQVSLEDSHGNIKWISGMHPLPWLALPPIKYHYAGSPGEGRIIGESIPLTNAQAGALIRKMEHLKFVGPYIPMFHDCRTFTCAVMASAQGHSTLPCYLLFKGHW
jgi:hypothetical protein